MSTILNRGSLPIWVYIIVIIVGSFAVVCTIAFMIRCWCIRRKSLKPPPESLPVRKMTVRRGRVVPASYYLSLTGSKFGMRHFEDNDTPSVTRSRSKSPFDWLNAMTREKDSQQDNLSQLESGSIRSIRSRTTSVANAIYTRWNYSRSNHSIVSEKESQVSVQEIQPVQPVYTPPSIARSPVYQPSFSRPFASRTPTSPLTNIRSLSPEEHGDLKETAKYTVFPQKRSSRSSQINTIDGNLTRLERPQQQLTESDRSPSLKTEPSNNTQMKSPALSLIPEVTTPNIGHSKQPSLGEQHPSASTPAFIRHEHVQEYPEVPLRASKSQQHLEEKILRRTLIIRSSLQPPTYKDSKKGTVLRKKSIHRAEMLAMVG